MTISDPDTNIIKNRCNELIGCKINIQFKMTFPNGDNQNGDINNRNIIGDCMENILLPFLQGELHTIEKGPKQSSPDFYNRNKEWELKVFNGSPGFNISNLNSYIEQLADDTYRKLYRTQYLIFKYSIENQYIIINDFKLCNVWDIILYTGKYPISLQCKKGMWYNIRPCSFNDMGVNKNPSLFIKNIIKAIKDCPNRINNKDTIIENIQTQFYKIQFESTLNSINSLNI